MASLNFNKFSKRCLSQALKYIEYKFNILKKIKNKYLITIITKEYYNINKKVRSLVGHDYSVNSLIQLNDNLIASASDDETIKIWSLISLKCLKTLKGHSDTVNCLTNLVNLVYVNGDAENIDKKIVIILIASGSRDKSIKIWNINEAICLKTLNGHGDTVKCLMQLNNNSLISGSNDTRIKVWDPNSGNYLKTLKNHSGCINKIIKLDNDRIASCSDDKTIKVINISTGNTEQTLMGLL